MKFPNVRYATFIRGLTQYLLASSVGMSDSRLRRCSRGIQDFTPEERARIARTLGFEQRSEVNPIILHVRRRTIEGDRRDLCAVFHLIPGIEIGSPVDRDVWPAEAKIPLGDCCRNKREQLVFVRIIEIAENAQERRELWVRSVVRLQGLDNCPHRITEAPEFLSRSLCELSTRIDDGELKGIRTRRRVLSRFVNGNGVNEVIKNAPETMNAVPDYQSPSFSPWLSGNVKNDSVTGKIRVWLLGHTVGVRVHPGSDLILDGLSVFLSPPPFCLNARQVQ